MGTHYQEAWKAAQQGDIAVVVVHPPMIGTLTWRPRESDLPFLLSGDAGTRAVALLTYMEVAHEQLAEDGL